MKQGLCVAILCAFASSAVAQQPEPSAIFPRQAAVDSSLTGQLVRLPLDAEVLAACREDLSDLRLFRYGQEVPYFVDTRARPWAGQSLSHPAPALHVERSQQPVQDGPALHTERILIEMPAQPPAGQHWELVLSAASRRFVRQVKVFVSHAEGEAGRELAAGSMFRLPWPQAEHLRIALPPTDATHVLVEVQGDDVYLEPGMHFESARERQEGPVLTLPLTEVSRRVAGDVITVTLQRPHGFVPDGITALTSDTTFHMGVLVRDVGPDRQTVLGEGAFVRIAGLPDVTLETLPLTAARGEVLQVELRGGDAPLPSDLRFEARVRQPALVFENQMQTVLHFGGGRARAPHYGVARVLGSVLGTMNLPRVAMGAIEDNPAFDTSPALSFAMHPGAPVDPRRHAHRQTLSFPESREGLIRILPSPQTLAAARADLFDLRIVDADGHQWAYLLGDPEPQDVNLVVGSRQSMTESQGEEWGIHGRASRFALDLPASPLRLKSVVLRTSARYVDREMVITGRLEGEDQISVMTAGRVRSSPNDDDTMTFVFASSQRVSDLAVWIADGDDAPLEGLEAHARVPIPYVYVAAPQGEYAMLVGDPTAEPPSYELTRARDLILSVDAVDATLGPVEDNAAYEPPSAFAKSWKDIALWVVLILGVLVLLVLTLRSAPLDDGSGPGSGTDADADADADSAPEDASRRSIGSAQPIPPSSQNTSDTPSSSSSEPRDSDSGSPVSEADPHSDSHREEE